MHPSNLCSASLQSLLCILPIPAVYASNPCSASIQSLQCIPPMPAMHPIGRLRLCGMWEGVNKCEQHEIIIVMLVCLLLTPYHAPLPSSAQTSTIPQATQMLLHRAHRWLPAAASHAPHGSRRATGGLVLYATVGAMLYTTQSRCLQTENTKL